MSSRNMLYQTVKRKVQEVMWTGQRFSETPLWLPQVVGLVAFVTAPQHKLYVEQPYAWYGTHTGTLRLIPGDHLIYELGQEIQVWSNECFRAVFMRTANSEAVPL